MKKIVCIFLAAATIASCSKDDGGGGTTTTPTNNGPTISSADVTTNFAPNKVLSGYIDTNISAIPVADTGVTFNYTNLKMTMPWKDSIKPPVNTTDYPSATYMRGINQQIIGQNLDFNQYYQISSSSWLNLGSYTAGLNITLPQLGSLNVPAQASKQNPSQKLVNFPIAYGDSISQISTNVLNADASAIIQSFPVTGPITTTQTTTITSKNIAWGTLKLNGYTDSMKVVVQKYTTSIKTDISSSNAILAGLIPTILQQFGGGITNGQVITQTSYRFWAAGKGLVMTINSNGSAQVTTGL